MEYEKEVPAERELEAAAAARNRRNVVLLGVIGNVLEWFDFSVFGYLAEEIGELFFPEGDAAADLLRSFAFFAGAFFMRPLGGLLFGHVGDRIGRKRALMLSIVTMALSTCCMGCLPTYKSVGAWAPILLAVARLFQGLSVGGQLVGAFLFTVEIAPPHQRGLYGAISLGSAVGGNALGSAVSTILHIALTKEQLASWGWRLPFLAGLLVGAAGLSLHSRVHDSKEFLQLKRHRATSSRPLVDAVKTAKARMLLVFLVAGLWCDGIYTFSVWIVSMQTSLLAQPTPHADLINTLMVILLVIAFPLAGMLADRTSRFATMTAGAVFMAVASVPAFWLLDRGTMGAMVVAQLPLVAGLALFGSVLPSWIVDRFPPALRFSAIGIGYNAAQALLGGTGPLISTALYDTTKTGAGPGAYLAVLAVVSGVSLAASRVYTDRQAVPQAERLEEDRDRSDSVVETQNILVATPADKARTRSPIDSVTLPTDAV